MLGSDLELATFLFSPGIVGQSRKICFSPGVDGQSGK